MKLVPTLACAAALTSLAGASLAQELPTIGPPYVKVAQAEGWQMVASVGSQIKEGEGATMTAVYLPLAVQEAERAYVTLAIDCKAASATRGKVIVVGQDGKVRGTPLPAQVDASLKQQDTIQRLRQAACERNVVMKDTFDDLDQYVDNYRNHRLNAPPASTSDLLVKTPPPAEPATPGPSEP